MNVKKNIGGFILGLILGATVCTGIGYHVVVRPDRYALSESRREADEYRARAIDSERRLADGIAVIETGERRINTSIGTIREAIEAIRDTRRILSKVKESLTVGISNRDS